MTGDLFPGRLVVDPDPTGALQTLNPGDYVHLIYTGEDGKPHDYWLARTPNGEGAALGAHQITEHEDGTITVSPSIEVYILVGPTPKSGERDTRPKKVLWHGFLERGIWREC